MRRTVELADVHHVVFVLKQILFFRNYFSGSKGRLPWEWQPCCYSSQGNLEPGRVKSSWTFCLKFIHIRWKILPRKSSLSVSPVHLVPLILRFVSSYHRQQIVFRQKTTDSRKTKKIIKLKIYNFHSPVEIGTSSDSVGDKFVWCAFFAKILNRIRPNQIAHRALSWRLSESIDVLYVL